MNILPQQDFSHETSQFLLLLLYPEEFKPNPRSPKETGTKPSLHLVLAPIQNSSFYSHTHTHTHDFVNIWEQKRTLGGKDGAIRVIAHDRFCIGKLKGYLPSKPQGFHTPPQEQHQEVDFHQILTEIKEKKTGFCEIKFVQFKFLLGICFD